MFIAWHLKDAYNGSSVGWNNTWLNIVNNNYIPVQFLLNVYPHFILGAVPIIEGNSFTKR